MKVAFQIEKVAAAAAAASKEMTSHHQPQPPSSKLPLRIGLLGCGAINSTVAEMIVNGQAGPCEISAILVRKEQSKQEIMESSLLTASSDQIINKKKNTSINVTTSADDFFNDDKNTEWTLCVEAAGQPAVRQHAKRCLEMGRGFMITSIGALTDDTLYEDLHHVAEANGSRLILCTGSMPAVDWMGSAALLNNDGCTSSNVVQVTQTKPPKAWLGTPAETDFPGLLTITKPLTVFEGSARDAASKYPKNANVAAMLALATTGLDVTATKLIADPDATGNLVELSFDGPAGTLKVEVKAAPSKSNPRTSAVVALSVVKAIRKLCCPVIIGL